MSNAIKALIERQAATADAYSPSRAFTGLHHGDIRNSFAVDDLGLSIEGAPEGERSRICALNKNPRVVVLAVDLVWLDDKTDQRATGLREAGLAIVAELRDAKESSTFSWKPRAHLPKTVVKFVFSENAP